MLTYATEIRMYSWALLFVTCAFLQAMKLIKEGRGKSFILLAIFSSLAAYTHYFACISAIIIYAELLFLFSINRKWKEFIYTLLSGIGVAVAYVPWLIVFVTQLKAVSESYWIDAVSLRGIVHQVLFLFKEKIVTLVILAVVFLGFVYALHAFIRGQIEPILGIGIWLGTIFIGNILSLLIRPIFVARYEMASAGCLWLAMAISLSAIDKQTLRKGVSLLLVAVCFYVDLRYARADYITNKKTQITVATLEQYMQDDTIIVSDSNHIQRVAAMQFPEHESVAIGKDLTELTQAVYSDLKLARCDEDAVGEYKGKKLLILEQDGELHTALAENGIEASCVGKYSMERYTFDLYIVNE